MEYLIRKTQEKPTLQGLWDVAPWTQAETLDVATFHSRSSDHHPVTRARVLYDAEGLYVIFRVEDRYVRAVAERYQDSVCQDSCVEFFVEPKPGRGYFNFEINCGGTLLLQHVEDATRTEKGFAKYALVSEADASMIRIFHSLPKRVPEEILTPVTWMVEYFIPFRFFEKLIGPIQPVAGTVWRANFYKCGDKTSHPHWASWAPVGEPLNFHKPERFAPIRFEA